MDVIRVYKFSLLLPLIMPLIIGVVLFPLLTIALYATVIGGVPYILLATLLLWSMRGKSEEQIRQILIWSPVLMLLLFDGLVVFGGVFILPKNRISNNLAEFAVTLFLLSSFILFVGYAYVLAVFGYVGLLKRQEKQTLVNTTDNESSTVL
jgi:hypothetical protein